MNTEDVIAEINRKYADIRTFTEEKAFFVSSAHLVHYILQTPNLQNLLNNLHETYKKRINDMKREVNTSSNNWQTQTEINHLPEEKQKEVAQQMHEELKSLLKADAEREIINAEIETNVDTAWVKLRRLHSLIFYRRQLEEEFGKDKNSDKYLQLKKEERELDRILLTTEQKLNRLDLVDVNPKTGEIIENNEREYFNHGDFLTYISLVHESLIKELTVKNSYPLELLTAIPNDEQDSRYKPARKMVEELMKKGQSDNFLLAKCLKGNRNLRRTKYDDNVNRKTTRNTADHYYTQINNVFGTINDYWEKAELEYRVKFNKKVSKIVALKT